VSTPQWYWPYQSLSAFNTRPYIKVVYTSGIQPGVREDILGGT
jgi:hypothetical protein